VFSLAEQSQWVYLGVSGHGAKEWRMEDPKVGDKVRHKNGCTAEVVALGSITTTKGPTVMYNLKFLDCPLAGANCMREEFTFPIAQR
jgi:hypothetical protein